MRRRKLLRRAPYVAAALLIALAGAYVALRDSSMVGVEKVTVRGASGPDAPKIEATLRQAAQEMTTLNVDAGELRETVDAYPTVTGVEVDRGFPHEVTITVLERTPVAVIDAGGRTVPLSADGRLLQGATPPEDVPALALNDRAPGSRIDDARGRRLVALAAAAPAALRRRAVRASVTDKGLTMTMDRGPDLFFGGAEDLQGKWKAVARVLADPSAEGATYIDARVPERVAAGGLAPLATEAEGEQTTPELPATEAPSTSTGA
jgi:cell division protein FtsQ